MTGSGGWARTRGGRAAAFLEAHPWIVYLGLTPFAHPILEILLFGERALQTAHDVFDDDIPRLFSIPADWRAFGPSLWDTHLTGGNALLAQFALPPLAPDVLLSFVLPPYLAYTLNAALMAFLAGLAMHLFLRESLRLPAIACFAGGVLAVFGFWHYILGYAALAAPLALLWSERAAAPGSKPKETVRLALLVAFLALSSQVQVVAILAGVTLLWILVPSRNVREAAERGVRWFRGWLAGAALAAPVLVTLLAAVASSHRTVWVIDPPADPIGQWLSDVGAIAFGVPVGGLDSLSPLYGTFFPGIAGLLVLAVSLAMPRPTRLARAALWLLVGLLVADLLALLAVPLQANSTLLKSFQFVRVLHLVPLAVAINVALGISWLMGGAEGRRVGGLPRAWLATAFAAAAAVAIAPQVLAIRRAFNRSTDGPLDLGNLEPGRAGWLLAIGAFAVGAVAAAVVVVAIARRLWTSRTPTTAAGSPGLRRPVLSPIPAVVLVAGLAAGQALFVRASVFTGTGLGTWADWVPATAAQRFVAEQPGAWRVLSVLEHANRSLVAGLTDAGGYEAVYPLRYHTLFGLLIKPQTDASEALAAYFGEWGNRAYAFNAAIDDRIADLLGIRWLLVRGEAIDADLAKRAGDQVDVPAWLMPRAELDGVRVFENPDAFPRAFVVHQTVVAEDKAALVEGVAAATAEELRSTIFVLAGEAPANLPSAGEAPLEADEAAQVTLDSPDRLEIRTRPAAGEGILVIRDTYTPGWVAEVDGRATDVFPVDLALRGVVVPAGDHVVTLAYRPIETYGGIALSALTALGLFGLLLAQRPRRRSAVVSEHGPG